MRILHFSSSLYPFGKGGTEVFIENLINEQRNMPEIKDLLWAVHDKDNLINLNSFKLNKLIKQIKDNSKKAVLICINS